MSAIAKFALDNPNAIKDLHKDIRRNLKRAATQTVNAVAFKARGNLKAYVQENFNNPDGLVTGRSLFVTKVPFGRTENLNDIRASVGFSERLEFMRRQDEGGWHTPKAPSTRLSIKTDIAKMEGMPRASIGKRGKITIRGKTIHTILQRTPRQDSPRARRVARAYKAYKTGLLMFLGPHNNLFRVTSFRAHKGDVRFETEMFVNRKYERTFTTARNFFMPTCREAAENIQELFNENFNKLANNH